MSIFTRVQNIVRAQTAAPYVPPPPFDQQVRNLKIGTDVQLELFEVDTDTKGWEKDDNVTAIGNLYWRILVGDEPPAKASETAWLKAWMRALDAIDQYGANAMPDDVNRETKQFRAIQLGEQQLLIDFGPATSKIDKSVGWYYFPKIAQLPSDDGDKLFAYGDQWGDKKITDFPWEKVTWIPQFADMIDADMQGKNLLLTPNRLYRFFVSMQKDDNSKCVVGFQNRSGEVYSSPGYQIANVKNVVRNIWSDSSKPK